jgi:hypothetical protein
MLEVTGQECSATTPLTMSSAPLVVMVKFRSTVKELLTWTIKEEGGGKKKGGEFGQLRWLP